MNSTKLTILVLIEKIKLIVYNKDSKKSEEIEIEENKEKIRAKRGDEVARFLGIWISEHMNKASTIKIIKKETDKLKQIVQKKKLTNSQIIYINNRVLISRIEYRAQSMVLNRITCKRIHSNFLKLLKSKCGLATNTTNRVLNHKNITGVQLL